MSDIERKLRAFSGEQLTGLPKNDPDRLQVEKMAQAVPLWDIVPRSVGETRPTAPEVLISRVTERLILPSPEALVATASAKLREAFGRDFEVPQPPETLFQDAENFDRLGIRKLEVYYQPSYRFDAEAELSTENRNEIPVWQKVRGVKPEAYFWQLLKEGGLTSKSAVLPEGWVLGDARQKPAYENGQQRYENDAFMENMMRELRAKSAGNGGIERNQYVPDNSRFGASPDEIESVIIPHFARTTQTQGIVECPSALEFNIRGNMEHPEWGQTNTLEWFRDKVFGGRRRLDGGSSGYGGLSFVSGWRSDVRHTHVGFRFQVRYPSQ